MMFIGNDIETNTTNSLSFKWVPFLVSSQFKMLTQKVYVCSELLQKPKIHHKLKKNCGELLWIAFVKNFQSKRFVVLILSDLFLLNT